MIRLPIIAFFVAALPCAAAAQEPGSPIVSSSTNLSLEMLWATMNERDRNYLERFSAIQSNVTTAKQELSERLNSVNEFRGQLRDQAATLMPRAEADNRIKTIEERIERLTVQVNNAASESKGASNLWGIIAAIGGIAIAVIAVGVNIRNSANRGTAK